jgi:hypothetical protein
VNAYHLQAYGILTGDNVDYLATLTTVQLSRLWLRVRDRIGDGGHFGWDWPTLWAVHPHFAAVLRAIGRELAAREGGAQ